MSSDSADPFYWMRVILASNRGKANEKRSSIHVFIYFNIKKYIYGPLNGFPLNINVWLNDEIYVSISTILSMKC